MHLTSISLKGYPPHRDTSFTFNKRANVFIGPNASGKTSILRAIREYFLGRGSDIPGELGTSDDWPLGDNGTDETDWDAVAFVNIPATRIHLQHYDAPRRPLDSEGHPLEKLRDNDSDIFDGAHVEASIYHLRNYRSPLYTPEFDAQLLREDREFQRALRVGYLSTREICEEIIQNAQPQSYVDLVGTKRASRYAMGVVTADDILGDPLYLGDLSAGTQGTLLWIWSLALRIYGHYHFEPGWLEQPAVLIVDEIENHLHPTWQRRVIPTLLKYFPNLQIFATTHSPFVVAGLKAGQIHLLKRDENGVVTASTSTEDVVGWTADEILRTMMDVEDPTDSETAAFARQLRQLRNEGPRASEAAEAQRQQRMQELRQKVDRDLLAGGPMAAQRQLFEAQFATTLEEYRRSRDLNQESG